MPHRVFPSPRGSVLIPGPLLVGCRRLSQLFVAVSFGAFLPLVAPALPKEGTEMVHVCHWPLEIKGLAMVHDGSMMVHHAL